MNTQLKLNPELVCDNCGRFGAFDLGDQHLCTDCYMEYGSCCMEFGGNDLWKKCEEEPQSGRSDLAKK